MEDRVENQNNKKYDSDWCDFSKDSAIKDALLSKIKRECFHVFYKAKQLTDNDLESVNAARKPRDSAADEPPRD